MVIYRASFSVSLIRQGWLSLTKSGRLDHNLIRVIIIGSVNFPLPRRGYASKPRVAPWNGNKSLAEFSSPSWARPDSHLLGGAPALTRGKHRHPLQFFSDLFGKER